MKYFVKNCACQESGVLPHKLALDSSADDWNRRVTFSFNLGPVCCAHCGDDYREIEKESESERQIREAKEAQRKKQ